MLHGNIAPSLYGINLAASNRSRVIAEARLTTMVLSRTSSLMQQCACSANQRQSLATHRTNAA
jgi:hypothetical protein